ncbi:MAG: class I SAM-dependent methyltransferase [Gammaproteobacteria bacterium]
MNKAAQIIQDDDYSFPYHYIPQFRPGFTQAYVWSWGIYYISALEFILERARECAPTSILDVGTGDGRMARELTLAFPDTRVVGLDYSERAIQLARALNPGLEFLHHDITAQTLGEQFDLVTLVEVFEHIPPESAKDFAAALPVLLKDNGILLVTVPHRNIPVSVKHFQHFSAQSLIDYFKDQFDVEEVVFLDKRSRWVRLIKNLLHNRYFTLNHWGIRNRLYLFYKRFFLVTDEAHCGRVFVKLRKKSRPA